ncbi:hypothetical protein ACSFA8_25145 [Variovorax sp. RT4R15]|uniref:hypothetical protein n=1 Tax=Variovorax sp. RT4R15 TaxID=3443737 RepID=UPI003F46FB81
MTAEEFTEALAAVGWKQSDLCRKTGLERNTPSRWATGAVPVPGWVPAYLGVLLELKRMHTKYLDPKDSRASD